MITKCLPIVISLLLILSFLYGCTERKDDSDNILIEYDSDTLSSRFGFMHPDSFEDMTFLGIFWQRPHPGPFIWNEIETSPGVFDWDRCDKEVKKSQKYGVNIIATIWPFADWDQSSCHSKISYSGLIFDELGAYRQKPCDMVSYQNFIEKLVERYDGDGIDDMPGLFVPIKYWEVSNEPSMQSDWLVFFVGSASDYFDILKATFYSVKNADSDAIVVSGGMAGVMDENIMFWSEVFGLGGSMYFDIGNIHSINSDSVAINGPEYRNFLDSNSIDRPFWITEVELASKDFLEGMEDLLVTSFVLAFASGAEKIFHPGIMKKSGKEDIYNALKTMVDKIDYFERVEKLKDGQYKFTIYDKVVYVLWGEENITDVITGQIKKTDFTGNESIISSDELILSDSPVYIEII